MLHMFGHHVVTCCNMFGVVGSNFSNGHLFHVETMYLNSIELYKHKWKFARVRNAVEIQAIGEHLNSFFELSHTFMCPTMLWSVVLNVAIVCPGLANTGKNCCNILCWTVHAIICSGLNVDLNIRNILRQIVANFCEILEDPSGYHCKVLEYHARLSRIHGRFYIQRP